MRFASLLLFVFPAVCGVEPAQVIGLVTYARGGWVDNVKPAVRYGYAVWSTSRLHISGQPDESAELKVRSYMNGQLISFKCSTLHCESPLDLGPVTYEEKGASPSGSLLTALREVVRDALSLGEGKTLAPYAHGLSKAAGAHLLDGIAAMDGNGVDLAGVFREMDAGEFAVEFCPVAKNGTSNCPPGPQQKWKWEPQNSTRIQPAQPTEPGLYEIGAYAQSRDGLAPVRESAMALLVRPSDFDNVQRRYRDAIRETKDWDRSEQAIAHRVFLQYLNSTLSR